MENPQGNEEVTLCFYNCFPLGHIYQFRAELEAENLGLVPEKCWHSRTEKSEENLAVIVD